jgi:hypothetical protein
VVSWEKICQRIGVIEVVLLCDEVAPVLADLQRKTDCAWSRSGQAARTKRGLHDEMGVRCGRE